MPEQVVGVSAPLQPSCSRSGHAPGQPSTALASSLVRLPAQILSMPPQDLFTVFVSETARVASLSPLFSSSRQLVVGGNFPFTFFSSHTASVLARPCAYSAEARAMARWHFVVSAPAIVVSERQMTMAA